MKYLGAISKVTEALCSFPSRPFNITVIQVSAPTNNAKEAEVGHIYDDLQDLLTLKKSCFSHHRDFPDGSDGKVSSCNVVDLGSISGLGRSPGEGNDNRLQYSCL